MAIFHSYVKLPEGTYLLGGVNHVLFSIIYGIIPTPLTNSYFSRWLKPPTRYVLFRFSFLFSLFFPFLFLCMSFSFPLFHSFSFPLPFMCFLFHSSSSHLPFFFSPFPFVFFSFSASLPFLFRSLSFFLLALSFPFSFLFLSSIVTKLWKAVGPRKELLGA